MALTAKKLVDCHKEGGGFSRRPGKRGRCKNPDVLRMRRENLALEQVVTEDGEVYLDLADTAPAPRRGVRPHQGWLRKSFGENLNPLWRYLQKSVGRNWDTVYSELCSKMDRRGTVSGHIFEHMFDYVVTADRVTLVEGKPHVMGYDGPEPITYRGSVGERQCFWVGPRDGKLKVGLKPLPTRWEVERKNRAKLFTGNTRDLGDNLWLCRDPESGLWYRVTYKPQVWHHYTQEVFSYKRLANGMTARDPRGFMIRVSERVPRKEALVKGAPCPQTLVLPDLGKDMVLAECRSASKKDLKTYT